MSDCRPSLLAWGDPAIAWIAAHRQGWLDVLMSFFSVLGEEGVLLITIALGYWLWNKQYFKTLCYGIFISLLLNLWIKGWFVECRPSPSNWLQPLKDISASFPSGHTQVSIVLWAGLAYIVRSRILSILFLSIGVLVGLSRPYLGVHYLHDVFAGWVIGLAVLWLCFFYQSKYSSAFDQYPLWSRTLIVILLFIVTLTLIEDPRGIDIIACTSLFGFWLGCQLEARYVDFVSIIRFKTIVGQLCIGVIGLVLLWKGIGMWGKTLPIEHMTYFKPLQYGLISLWIAYGAPLLFVYFLNIKSKKKSTDPVDNICGSPVGNTDFVE